MLLKIIAVVYGLWFVQAALDSGFYDTPAHMVSSTLALGGLLALFDHAFRMGLLSANIWRVVALVYVADGLVHVVPGAKGLIEAQRFEVLAGAAAISFVFQLPMLFSLWRLSFPSARSDQTGLARIATR
ncbi:hypothetical protein [Bradyrhizobium sp. SZCCHNS3002]|uniref:hypothetical protein n=1 Tax=Bradyrhizobium TaxID=374 RepID=UPI0028E61296|nr:hypothetical protein [Bradyrhizobium sp. SZCCHNS3002]